jgi:hypothetical protein
MFCSRSRKFSGFLEWVERTSSQTTSKKVLTESLWGLWHHREVSIDQQFDKSFRINNQSFGREGLVVCRHGCLWVTWGCFRDDSHPSLSLNSLSHWNSRAFQSFVGVWLRRFVICQSVCLPRFGCEKESFLLERNLPNKIVSFRWSWWKVFGNRWKKWFSWIVPFVWLSVTFF